MILRVSTYCVKLFYSNKYINLKFKLSNFFLQLFYCFQSIIMYKIQHAKLKIIKIIRSPIIICIYFILKIKIVLVTLII